MPLHAGVARADAPSSASVEAAIGGALRKDLWWARERGGVGNGEALNHVLPINPQPLVGGQNWYDNVCRVRRVASART